MELWRSVPGYEGLYEVSDQGRVRNSHTGHLCKLHDNRSGYLRVRLSRGGALHSYFVARLVVQVFLGPLPADMTVNHRDYVRTNNHIDNLEIMSRADNIRDMNTRRTPETILRGSRHGMAKLDEATVLQIFEMRAHGLTTTAIARALGHKKATIKNVVRGRTWGHVVTPYNRAVLARRITKLTPAAIPVIRAMRAEGRTYQAIAERFGVDQSMIYLIIKGKKYQHIP